MKYGVFKDIILVPQQARATARGPQIIANTKGLPRYCLQARDGKLVNESAESTSETDKIETLQPNDGERFVLGGRLLWHFGHFVAEYCHRLWILEKPEFENATVIFVTTRARLEQRPFFKQVMAYLGVKRWLILTETTKVSNLTIAQSGQFLRQKALPDYRDFLRRKAAQAALTPIEGADDVALLRGHVPGSGHILGEHAFAQYLADAGYTLFYPEKHDINTQLGTLMAAKRIIISEGSSCHLFDLLPQVSAKLAYIARRQTPKLFNSSIAPKVPNAVAFMDTRFVMVGEGSAKLRNRAVALSALDHEALRDFLIENGFLSADSGPLPTMDFGPEIKAFMAKNYRKFEGKDVSDAQLTTHLIDLIHRRNTHIRWLEGWLFPVFKLLTRLGFKRFATKARHNNFV